NKAWDHPQIPVVVYKIPDSLRLLAYYCTLWTYQLLGRVQDQSEQVFHCFYIRSTPAKGVKMEGSLSSLSSHYSLGSTFNSSQYIYDFIFQTLSLISGILLI